MILQTPLTNEKMKLISSEKEENILSFSAEILVNILSFMNERTFDNIVTSSSLFQKFFLIRESVPEASRRLCKLNIPNHILRTFEDHCPHDMRPRTYHDAILYWKKLSKSSLSKKQSFPTIQMKSTNNFSIFGNLLYTIDAKENTISVFDIPSEEKIRSHVLCLSEVKLNRYDSIKVFRPRFDNGKRGDVHIFLFGISFNTLNYLIETGNEYSFRRVNTQCVTRNNYFDNPFIYCPVPFYSGLEFNAHNYYCDISILKVSEKETTKVGTIDEKYIIQLGCRNNELLLLFRNKVSIYVGVDHKRDIMFELSRVIHLSDNWIFYFYEDHIFLYSNTENNLYFLEDKKPGKLKKVASRLSSDEVSVLMNTTYMPVIDANGNCISLVKPDMSIEQLVENDAATPLVSKNFEKGRNYKFFTKGSFYYDKGIYLLYHSAINNFTFYKFYC